MQNQDNHKNPWTDPSWPENSIFTLTQMTKCEYKNSCSLINNVLIGHTSLILLYIYALSFPSLINTLSHGHKCSPLLYHIFSVLTRKDPEPCHVHSDEDNTHSHVKSLLHTISPKRCSVEEPTISNTA